MNKTVSALLLTGALAFNLAACGTAATTATMPRPPEVASACRETGLANAQDSRMGQRDCTPLPDPQAAATKR